METISLYLLNEMNIHYNQQEISILESGFRGSGI